MPLEAKMVDYAPTALIHPTLLRCKELWKRATMLFKKIRNALLGAPRNPFDTTTRKSIALIAFFAWIGLGADGLSSSAYGPEEAFLALGQHYHLALYLAILTAITVFII